MNIPSLRGLLPPKGQTIKKIRDTYYLYQKVEGKDAYTCEGVATDEQIAMHTDKARASVIRWLIKNEAQFLSALKLLTDLKNNKV